MRENVGIVGLKRKKYRTRRVRKRQRKAEMTVAADGDLVLDRAATAGRRWSLIGSILLSVVRFRRMRACKRCIKDGEVASEIVGGIRVC